MSVRPFSSILTNSFRQFPPQKSGKPKKQPVLKKEIFPCSCKCHSKKCISCHCFLYPFETNFEIDCKCSKSKGKSAKCFCLCHKKPLYCPACECTNSIVACPDVIQISYNYCTSCPSIIKINSCAELFKTVAGNYVSCGHSFPFDISAYENNTLVECKDVKKHHSCQCNKCDTVEMMNANLPCNLTFTVQSNFQAVHVSAFCIMSGPNHNISKWTLDYYDSGTMTWIQAFPSNPLEKASSNYVIMAQPFVDLAQGSPILIGLDSIINGSPKWRLVIHEYIDPMKNHFSLCGISLKQEKPLPETTFPMYCVRI